MNHKLMQSRICKYRAIIEGIGGQFVIAITSAVDWVRARNPLADVMDRCSKISDIYLFCTCYKVLFIERCLIDVNRKAQLFFGI